MLLMAFRVDEQGFVIGVTEEASFAFARLFNEFTLAVIDGYLVPKPAVGIIRAKLGDK